MSLREDLKNDSIFAIIGWGIAATALFCVVAAALGGIGFWAVTFLEWWALIPAGIIVVGTLSGVAVWYWVNKQ